MHRSCFRGLFCRTLCPCTHTYMCKYIYIYLYFVVVLFISRMDGLRFTGSFRRLWGSYHTTEKFCRKVRFRTHTQHSTFRARCLIALLIRYIPASRAGRVHHRNPQGVFNPTRLRTLFMMISSDSTIPSLFLSLSLSFTISRCFPAVRHCSWHCILVPLLLSVRCQRLKRLRLSSLLHVVKEPPLFW